MKNRRIAAFAAMGTIVFLSACGLKSDQSVTSGEMVVPEVSSEDLLISSLEYLLLDETEETEDTDGQDLQGQDGEEQDAQNIQDTDEDSEEVPDVQPAQKDNDMQGVEAVIYYGSGGSGTLKKETVAVEAVTPDELVNALARHNIVSLDTKVISFGQEEQDDVSVLYLDLSMAAGEYLRTMSKEAECIIVAAIVDTFAENYNADAVCILVEGEALVTSNAEYTEPIKQCTPEELLEMLQASSDADDLLCRLPLAVEKK